MNLFNTMAAGALALLLAACATVPSAPVPARLGLKLAPETLGARINLQQHLRVERGARIDEIDVALEVEPGRLDLVGLAFGQRVLSLHYDGKEMTSWRHVMLPAQVGVDDVLEDLQLTLWPAAAIRAALPAGWSIDEQPLARVLSLDGAPVMRISYSAMPRWSGTVVLDNLRYGYRLTVDSAPLDN